MDRIGGPWAGLGVRGQSWGLVGRVGGPVGKVGGAVGRAGGAVGRVGGPWAGLGEPWVCTSLPLPPVQPRTSPDAETITVIIPAMVTVTVAAMPASSHRRLYFISSVFQSLFHFV